MNTKKIFGIIGGDLRQYYLAKSLLNDNHEVMTFGLEKATKTHDNFKKLSLSKTINLSDYIILPVPTTRDGTTLNAPFAENEIYIDNEFINLLKNKKVFGGMIIPQIKKQVKKETILLYDYYNEDFIIKNAFLTAKGAIKVFLENSSKAVNQCKCLVVGYGRIGKYLCEILKKLGANVTATARNIQDETTIKQNGYSFTNTNEIIGSKDLPLFDAVFNTAPAVILDKNVLEKLSKDVLIIDLASLPGGVDKTHAKNLHLKLLHELGVPGKYFPKSSSKIIKKTIYKIIKEENI